MILSVQDRIKTKKRFYDFTKAKDKTLYGKHGNAPEGLYLEELCDDRI